MKKTTKKRSYKNAVSIGIAAFASVALLSTGLAAFVLIRNAEKTLNGEIVVAEVVDASIDLQITSGENGKIRLDADKDDKNGRVQSEVNGVGENLTHTVGGTVAVKTGKTVAENVILSYVVDVMKGKEEKNSDFETAMIGENKALAYKDGFELGKSYTVTPQTAGQWKDEEKTIGEIADFSFEFGFKWGAKYSGVNPSFFYDLETVGELPGGLSILDSVVESDLNNLKTVLEEYSFRVTVSAVNTTPKP